MSCCSEASWQKERAMVSVGFHGQRLCDSCSSSTGSLARRLVTVAQLCRVLGQVLLDDVTRALHALGGDSARVSVALRGLRHGWWRAVTQASLASLAVSIAFKYSSRTSLSIAASWFMPRLSSCRPPSLLVWAAAAAGGGTRCSATCVQSSRRGLRAP